MIKSLLVLVLMLTSSTIFAGSDTKMAKDYDAALKEAKKSNKSVFIVFTNSKLCVPCKKFKSNIFNQKEFMDYAKDKYVFLIVDYSPNFDEKNKKTLNEIEDGLKLPKKLAQRGRGPWPYLMIISTAGKMKFSGKAYDTKRNTVKTFTTFLKEINKKG